MTKKVFLFVLVLAVAWLGLIAGQLVTREVVARSIAQAAQPEAKTESAVPARDRYKNLELFQKVLHFVENNYVDDIKNQELIHGAIKGMMSSLDPHSAFLTADVFKDMKIDTSGKFGGLGIEIGIRDNILTVVAPIEDTPAWKAGLKPGDRIVKIEGVSTKGMNLVEAVNKMRGKKGTKVVLAIYRKGFEKVRDVSIVRDIIKIRSVKSELLPGGMGYVRLSSFNESASADVKKAIDEMEKKNKEKLKGIVFDLRTNPGGLLDQAVEVSSLFLDQGVIVSTIGRDRDQKEVKHAKKRSDVIRDIPLAVLVNSSTASAAEIVAGALQDHNRAIVMGETTFGKGSVQTVIDLGDDMGLKLTIARYYTPSGRSIQEKGVQPDIQLETYDPKLLKQAKVETESMREKDLPGAIHDSDADTGSKEFSPQELEDAGKKKSEKDESVDDMTPMRFDPKDDYQVKEAVNYLKSYEIFKKIGKPGKAAS